MARLWIHECRRVFTDRLISEADQLLVEDLMKKVVLEAKGDLIDPNMLDEESQSILFCNFSEINSFDYNLVTSRSDLYASLQDIIENYN